MANDVLTAFYGKCTFGISPTLPFALCRSAKWKVLSAGISLGRGRNRLNVSTPM